MSPRPGISPALQVAAIFGKAIEKSTGKVDVLAVMDSAARFDCYHAENRERMAEARAAVAGLIEAASRIGNNPSAAAMNNLRDALARVGRVRSLRTETGE